MVTVIGRIAVPSTLVPSMPTLVAALVSAAYGAYAAALPAVDGEDAVAALLRYLGRQP